MTYMIVYVYAHMCHVHICMYMYMISTAQLVCMIVSTDLVYVQYQRLKLTGIASCS